jgi:hypothetical protein
MGDKLLLEDDRCWNVRGNLDIEKMKVMKSFYQMNIILNNLS